MSKTRSLVRAFLTVALGAAVGCSHDAEVLNVRPADPLFGTYVAIGNSITAGYQSDGITNTTQQQSFAFLLASQMRTRFAYPALAGRGCPPPLTNWQTGARAGAGSTSTTCDLRTATSATDVLNSVAVPGAASTEVNSPTSPYHNTLTTLFLGGETQVQRAIEAHPTFLSIWIGNNDVLQAAATGLVTATPGISRGITPVATYIANYDGMLSALTAGAPNAKGVLIGTVNTGAAPILFPVSAFNNAQFAAGFSQLAGGTVTLHPNCTGSAALVSFAIIPQMRAYNPATGAGHPRTIVCQKNTPGVPPPVGDIFILDDEDQAALTAAVSAYNTHVQAKATELGWAYADPNALITALRTAGCILPAPNLLAAATSSPFGACVSLDGVHPSATGQAQLANALITVINAKYGTTLAPVTVP
jgi:lysophospholipase L1-like esterase